MPYLGASLVDDRGLLVLRDWITDLKPNQRDISPATRSQRESEELALTKLKAGDAAQLDTLLGTGSGALSVLLAIVDRSLAGDLRAQAIAKGSALSDPLRRDLFERFLPESQRRKTLGAAFKPEALLAQKGDATRGKTVFAGVCIACHRAGDAGVDFGPDLSHIGTKWNRAAILEQIVAPSKLIEPQWMLATVEMKGGESKTGFIASRTDAELTLKMAGGIVEKIPTAQIARTGTARISLMPEGLLQNLTPQEAADLLDYLTSLK
jgi:putative heme-binding domain-containing protein